VAPNSAPDLAASSGQLRRLELDITRRLDGILHGDYRGLVPGHGSEPGEARLYEPGDDVRRIDWNVTARTTETHIRETIADRELECWITIDGSPSLDFGTDATDKAHVALAAAAGVGFLTSRGGNRVGALIGSPHDLTTIPPRSGRKHLMALLHRIEGIEHSDGPSEVTIADLIARTMVVARKRGLVVVISDFIGDPAAWQHELTALSARHEVLCIEVVDRREMELPNAGILTLIDVETGRTREIDTRRRKTREAYRQAAADRSDSIDQTIRRAGADHLRLDTSGSWLVDLVAHVDRRRRRLRTSGGKR
jgi:uncharacterized protein (DUF58 family)